MNKGLDDLLRRLLMLPEQASTWSLKVDHLHFFVITTTAIASFGVGTTALLLFVKYRRRGEGPTSRVKASLRTEAAIIGIPLFFFLLWFWIGFRDYMTLANPPADAIDVYVSAKQWMWQFSYPGGPNSINELKVPADRPVRLLLTSRDVIHSFYVPAFRLKQDAVPGRYTQTWFKAIREGKFDIFCAEYCGLEHSRMRGTVDVLSPSAWDAWMDEQTRGISKRQDSGPGPDEIQPVAGNLAREGKRVAADQGCLRCHTTDGTPHIGPTWLDLYHRKEPLAGGGSVIADEAYLTESMMDPMAKIVAGYKPVMPTYQGRLTGPEAAAILEFIKTLRTDRVVHERTEQVIPGAGPVGTAPFESPGIIPTPEKVQ